VKRKKFKIDWSRQRFDQTTSCLRLLSKANCWKIGKGCRRAQKTRSWDSRAFEADQVAPRLEGGSSQNFARKEGVINSSPHEWFAEWASINKNKTKTIIRRTMDRQSWFINSENTWDSSKAKKKSWTKRCDTNNRESRLECFLFATLYIEWKVDNFVL